MLYLISKLVLKLKGWKVVGGIPEGIKKCVVVAAPHTSMWDFIWGRLAYWTLRVKVKVLIKKESFGLITGPLLRWSGGIPVDRGKSGNMVETVAKLFDNYESLYITITPEGTRKYNDKWKKGFYYIALKANVPLALGVLDYKKKEGGIGMLMTPSGNFEEDFKIIEEFYRGHGARHPDRYNLS